MSYSPQLRTAVLLTGHGTGGAYHAGVLRALHEAGVKIDVMSGRGIGVVGALFSAIDAGVKTWEEGGVWRRRPPVRMYEWRRPLQLAAMLVIAFQLGRYMPTEPERPVVVITESPESAGNLLESELGRHLERSRRVLVELVNSPDAPSWNITAERETAEDLLENNRLYRQTASQVGQTGMEDTLEDLERIDRLDLRWEWARQLEEALGRALDAPQLAVEAHHPGARREIGFGLLEQERDDLLEGAEAVPQEVVVVAQQAVDRGGGRNALARVGRGEGRGIQR